jgi:hypothetical protein
MNNQNSIINMSKRDYFALPPDLRAQSNGAFVRTVRQGKETWVRVNMLE